MPDDRPSAQRPELAESLSWNQVRTPMLRSAAAVLALVMAAVVGYWSAHPSTPGDSSIDAGFLRDIAAHQEQSVSMSWTVLAAQPDTDTRTLARAVITSQQTEIGRAEGLLADWNLSTRPHGRRMDWMRRTGHQHAGLAKGQTLLPDGRMPGTASPAQLATLESARGTAAEVEYLQLLLVHERANVQMDAAIEGSSTQTGVVTLARADDEWSRRDIAQVKSFLTKRHTSVWTSAQAGQPVIDEARI